MTFLLLFVERATTDKTIFHADEFIERSFGSEFSHREKITMIIPAWQAFNVTRDWWHICRSSCRRTFIHTWTRTHTQTFSIAIFYDNERKFFINRMIFQAVTHKNWGRIEASRDSFLPNSELSFFRSSLHDFSHFSMKSNAGFERAE